MDKAKFFSLSLSALFAAALLAGCSDSSAQESDSETAQALDVSAQLALIAENAATWGTQSEDSDSLAYAVTDLDQNGRLEIVSVSVRGTGYYTTATLYEVNEAGDGLTRCDYGVPEGDSEADLSFSSAVSCYFDAESGQYTYLFGDTTRNGAAEYYERQVALSLQDGAVTAQSLGMMTTLYDADGEASVSYADAGGSAIDEAAYLALPDEAFAGQEEKEAALSWFSPELPEGATALPGAADMDADELLQALTASWEGFSLQ